MKLLRIAATPLTIFASIVVFFSGLWMYFFSKGKILEEVHSQIGLIFFGAVILHLVVNKAAFFHHFKSSKTYGSAAAVLIFSAGVLFFQQQKGDGGGVPPGRIFHQMESAKIEDLSRIFQADVVQVISAMEKDGISVPASTLTLTEVANASGKEPRQLLGYFFKK